MEILVIGSGGREHALVWKLNQSEYVNQIYVAPGNAGICQEAECVDISSSEYRSLASFVENKAIDMTVVGPEEPLANGIVDYFQKRGLRIFGPTQRAAKIESSKIFAKNFMREYNIPTGSYCTFDSPEEAFRFISDHDTPLVVKADGLAAGKGSIVAHSQEEGKDAVRKLMIERTRGEAGKRIIVEEFLEGWETSILAFTDGEHIKTMVPSQDYKRAYEGDKGPNTGGMGAIAPINTIVDENIDFVKEHIFRPAIEGLKNKGVTYKGVLYAGLMMTETGPKVLEFNCRFGDPESQVLFPLLETDLAEIMLFVVHNRLNEAELEWKDDMKSVCVIMASGGYPKRYKKGYAINGLQDANMKEDNSYIFHAGTAKRGDSVLTDGGRVLGVSSWDTTVQDAREKAYSVVKQINFKNSFSRSDIAKDHI